MKIQRPRLSRLQPKSMLPDDLENLLRQKRNADDKIRSFMRDSIERRHAMAPKDTNSAW